jgi:hypothetical protein
MGGTGIELVTVGAARCSAEFDCDGGDSVGDGGEHSRSQLGVPGSRLAFDDRLHGGGQRRVSCAPGRAAA